MWIKVNHTCTSVCNSFMFDKAQRGIKMQGFRHPGCITCEHPEHLNRFYLQI